jgi:hypothetical protein
LTWSQLSDCGVDVGTEWRCASEIRNDRSDAAGVIDETGLRHVFAGDSLVAAGKDVIVT